MEISKLLFREVCLFVCLYCCLSVLVGSNVYSKGRERKARDVRCHKIASDPICFGPLYNETQLFLGFLEISKLLFREVCLFVCTVVCVCVLGSIAASIKAVRGKDKMQFVIK